MRKWLLAGLGLALILLFSFGAEAISPTFETEASGTSAISITGLRAAYKILAVHPWTQDVIVTVTDRNGNTVGDYTVEAGSWRNVDITNAGAVSIARATATVVDWQLGIDRDASIGGSAWNSAAIDSVNTNLNQIGYDIDSLRVLAEAPEPRTTSSTQLLYQFDCSNPDSQVVGPVTPTNVNGARALLLDMEWDAGTTDFAFEYVFSTAADDTTMNRFGVVAGAVVADGLDTLVVDESDWAFDHFTYQIPLDGSMAVGYFFIRVYSGADIRDLDATLHVVW